MKRCFKCQQEKPIADFYKHPKMADGHLNKCIECTKKDVIERETRLRATSPGWIIQERERGRQKYYRLNYKDKPGLRGKEKKNVMSRYFDNNPEIRIAHNKTSNAIRMGKLIKQPCEVCGELKVEAHHDDYTKPLEVRWLCVKHHNEHHVKMRELELLKAAS